MPTSDACEAVAAVGTEGPDSHVSNEKLVEWLRETEKLQQFSILGIGRDFLEGKFMPPLNDPTYLMRRINDICPDGKEGSDTERRPVEQLQKTNKLFLR